jgi:hypothetical protein
MLEMSHLSGLTCLEVVRYDYTSTPYEEFIVIQEGIATFKVGSFKLGARSGQLITDWLET